MDKRVIVSVMLGSHIHDFAPRQLARVEVSDFMTANVNRECMVGKSKGKLCNVWRVGTLVARSRAVRATRLLGKTVLNCAKQSANSVRTVTCRKNKSTIWAVFTNIWALIAFHCCYKMLNMPYN